MEKPKTKRCPFCSETIARGARKCRYCGEFLDPTLRHTGSAAPVIIHTSDQNSPKWSPGVAAVLSLVIPGAGQIYKGQILNGIVWLVVVIIGYLLFIFPGLILHLFCIVGAAMGDPRK